MAFDFRNLYNKAIAEPATKINREANKLLGTDFFQDVKKIEEPKEYPPLSSFPAYNVPEPPQWPLLTGTEKQFPFKGNIITVSQNLDTCMQYVNLFKESAKYYSTRFAFRYNQCVVDYDAFLAYFEEIYLEGLKPMIERASSLLLPFNVFSVSYSNFFDYHVNTYKTAINSYNAMFGIVEKNKQQAENLGNTVGGAIQMQGGGFGVKGAMKGVAQAEAFNLAMAGIGKYFAHQAKLSPEQKATIFSKFKKDVFFNEVYIDYINTFFSLIEILSNNGVLGEVSTRTGEDYNTMITNLKNPMFPEEKVAPLLTQLITKYPFTKGGYEVIESRYGETDETKAFKEYFSVSI